MTLWRPPQSRLLCRHRHPPSGRVVYTNGTASPAGCQLEHVLGCVREYPLSGTTPLLREDERGFVFAEPVDLRDPSLLGFVEQTPLPLFDPVLSGRHPGTGERVLVAGEEDPLAALMQDPTVVGYIEPHPIRPRLPAHIDVTYGLTGLVRTVDLQARRHRYGVGRMPTGVAAGELGALFAGPTGDCDPVWIADGRVFAAAEVPLDEHPSVRAALRWTGDPLTWRGFSRPGAKIRASARRAYDSARILASTPVAPERPRKPAGYLLRSATSRTVPLYAARHPVTGDQLLSTDRREAGNLGYREVGLLGHLVARAPVTGELGPRRPIAPWAARFGLTPLPDP